MIRYAKNPTPFAPPSFTNITDFIDMIKRVSEDGRTVEVELQPGDITRYHWVIHDGIKIYDVTNERTITVGPGMDPWEAADKINAFTICLMVDVINRLNDWDARWYDYDKACPIKDGEPIR